MNLDRYCVRCGKPECGETELLSEGELPVPDNLLYEVENGFACRQCLSLRERRLADSQCERCGAQFYDDGRNSDAGWSLPEFGDPELLCPSCQTTEEDASSTRRFLDLCERGRQRYAAEGREYPEDLARQERVQRIRLGLREYEIAELNRRLDGT